MSESLDTETKALLQKRPPLRIAPSVPAAFTLVLLARGMCDSAGILSEAPSILQISADETRRCLSRRLPVRLKTGLSYEDARIAQDALVTWDAVSVFLRDEVVAEGEEQYLKEIYARLLAAPEFQYVSMKVTSIPKGRDGEVFRHRLLRRTTEPLPRIVLVMRKKARIMEWWAAQIGAQTAVLS